MTRQEAEVLYETLRQREDIIRYAKHIPGFWAAWTRGDTHTAVVALRAFLVKMAEGLNAQPEMAALLTEKLDQVTGRTEPSVASEKA